MSRPLESQLATLEPLDPEEEGVVVEVQRTRAPERGQRMRADPAKWLPPLAWATGVALVLGGCTTVTPAKPAAPPSPVLLAARQTSGGLCRADAPCGDTLIVQTDGSWELVSFEVHRTGVLPADRLAALAEAVERTGLADAPAFTGTCPIAYDGQEVTYRWRAAGGEAKVGSCEREVDPADPLVSMLDELAAGPA